MLVTVFFCIFVGEIFMVKPFSKVCTWLYLLSDALVQGSFLTAKPSIHFARPCAVLFSCTHLGFPHSWCHWVRKNLPRSDMLPHLGNEKEGIRTPQPASTKRMVVKEASSIGRSCLLYQFTSITKLNVFWQEWLSLLKYQCTCVNTLLLLITVFGETRYNLHTVIWFYPFVFFVKVWWLEQQMICLIQTEAVVVY